MINISDRFKDKNLFKQALVHRSYLNESSEAVSNERLEFLGDSVISSLISAKLYSLFPKYPEGDLTNLRSALVRTESFAQIATELGLGSILLMSHGEERGGGRTNKSLLADAFEAIVGALFLDSGFVACENFLSEILYPKIMIMNKNRKSFDYKSQLQEFTQKNSRVSPTYRILDQAGPDHDKTFTVGVFVKDVEIGRGAGKSKQFAEQEAARTAIENQSANKV
jgi:ribonuclease-3